MNIPENYYAILGIPMDSDAETIKHAYRQLARRFHPDLAGPDSMTQMKRINHAYAILGDAEKKRQYDSVLSGIIDVRKPSFSYAAYQQRMQQLNEWEENDYSGLKIFSTPGPFHTTQLLHSDAGIITSLNSVRSPQGLLVAAGSLDGKGTLWLINGKQSQKTTTFATSADFTVESIRELRFSETGSLLAGWHRLGLHVWDTFDGSLLWSYALHERAVSAHYSLDIAFQIDAQNARTIRLALPHLATEKASNAPRAWGVRSTDVVTHDFADANDHLKETRTCTEEALDKRHFWAIRMRALAQSDPALLTFSCAQIAGEQQEMALVRRWNLAPTGRAEKKRSGQLATSIIVGPCADCTAPYATTSAANRIAFVYKGNTIRLCDTTTGTYTEFASGTIGSSGKIALSPDAHWLAVAREDSEINEGVIDLWSTQSNQIEQKLYHPWQISALHFTHDQLLVALTDGSIQIWSHEDL